MSHLLQPSGTARKHSGQNRFRRLFAKFAQLRLTSSSLLVKYHRIILIALSGALTPEKTSQKATPQPAIQTLGTCQLLATGVHLAESLRTAQPTAARSHIYKRLKAHGVWLGCLALLLCRHSYVWAQPETDAEHSETRSENKAKDASGKAAQPSYRPAKSHAEGKPKALPLKWKGNPKAVVIPIHDAIELGVAAFIHRALEEHRDAEIIIFDINTFGGRVDAAVQIRDAIFESSATTVAFVHPRAISAGALIALACKYIVVSKAASIGAATPMRGDGQAQSEKIEEKMISYMRTEMRATAEANNRRGDIAEAMVDPSVEIPEVVAAGKLLTLDTQRALEFAIADTQAESRRDLLAKLGAEHAQLSETKINWAERIARILTGPVLSGMLISLGMLALMIAFYTGNFAIAGSFGLLCLSMFFLGHLVVHLAGWEELLLFALGAGLLAVEAFVIPGFGVTGAAGIVAILASLVLSLIGVDLSISLNTGLLTRAVARVSASLAASLVLTVIVARWLPRSRYGRNLVLTTSASKDDGFVSTQQFPQEWIGKIALTKTPLRPSGKIRLDGRQIQASSESEWIDAGVQVRVLRIDNGNVIVRSVS